MLLMGIDIGTSSIKVSVVDGGSQVCIASAQYPEFETEIIAPHFGWAEQRPELWWENVNQAILKCNSLKAYNPREISAIGIAYQMHGLVLVDKDQNALRNSIIWCDSRAVEIGNRAFKEIGAEKCLSHLLNSPGNFTASKLAWVKKNEPEIYEKIEKILLPGDFIAMKLTGQSTTTVSALSEGIFWDFIKNEISSDILHYFGFSKEIFPNIVPLFGNHGFLKETVARKLGLKCGISISYKAGDQLNNAFSLNVMRPGEVAATAGTSGVIYAVGDKLSSDKKSRINSFAHVNYSWKQPRIGNLLCINGVGIFNRWIKNLSGEERSYASLNESAGKIKIGSDGLLALPFGNGAERMLENNIIGSHFLNLNFNIHTPSHLARAAQEGIAFSFRYGLDIMKENGILPKVIRVGKSNLFLSRVFTDSFVGVTQTVLELYNNDGSIGAAIGAGIGNGYFKTEKEAFSGSILLEKIEPNNSEEYEKIYQYWRTELEKRLP